MIKRKMKVVPYPILGIKGIIPIMQDCKFAREQRRIHMIVSYELKYNKAPPTRFSLREWYKAYLLSNPNERNLK